jgi:N-acyl-D-aspartate/D-glutamate deacylase
MLDILIRDATLVDGSGAPAVRADIGVKDGRIAEVGRIPPRTANGGRRRPAGHARIRRYPYPL